MGQFAQLIQALRGLGLDDQARADNLESEDRVSADVFDKLERLLAAASQPAVHARMDKACWECGFCLPLSTEVLASRVHAEEAWFAYVPFSKLQPYLMGGDAVPDLDLDPQPTAAPPAPALRRLGTKAIPYAGMTGDRRGFWISTYDEATDATRARDELGLAFLDAGELLYRLRFPGRALTACFTPTAFDARAAPFWGRPDSDCAPFGMTRRLQDFAEVAPELVSEPVIPIHAELVGQIGTKPSRGYLAARLNRSKVPTRANDRVI